jgi:hypothetical protein
VKIHRAATMVAIMLLAIGVLAVMMVTALVVVLLAAAVGGIGFSWKRYYRR